MSLGRHPGGSQRVLQVLGTPGTGMEACRWILEVQSPQIGKAGFGHLGLHRENGKVKGWEVWG